MPEPATGEPEAYAVVPSDVVSAGSERAVPGLIEGVAGGTNYGNIGVACSSPLDEFVENFAFASADDCWSSCAAAHGEALVAVTFYPADNGCYCQDDCTCMQDAPPGVVAITRDSAVDALPSECEDVERRKLKSRKWHK